jgi:hypothetical protein
MILRRILLICIISFCSVTGYSLDRQAFTFTNYNLRVRIDPAKQGFAVTGTITARNDAATPEKNLVLQISGTLAWTSVKIGDQDVPYVQQPYTSDIDHSGQLTEAILNLPKPVAPGGSVTVEFEYEGTIPLNTGRLLRVNTPETYAARTDWDRISDNFIAVRGLGYVVWYPVAMDAATLSDGSGVFDSIAEWNRRHRASTMEATFTVPAGTKLASNADSTQRVAGGEIEITYHSLGTRAPAFVIAPFETIDRPNMTVYHLADHTQTARDYINAAEKVMPQMTDWFGTPKKKLIIIELPDQEVLPFDDGSEFFFTPLMPLEEPALEMMLAHQVVHTIIDSRRPWIQEGLGYLAQLLVREKEGGRDQALLYLHQFNGPLAQIEKAGLEAARPQPLATTNDQLINRAKAAYVWFMLRDLVGDDQLSAAVHKYQAAADTQPGYMQSLAEAQIPKRSLEAFFDDWVYKDKGLADFKIDTVYPRATLGENYIVTVTVENRGDVGANAIVLVQSDKGERAEHTWVAAKSKAVIRVSYPGVPQKVLVNDGSVPEWNLDNNEYTIPKLPDATPE